MKRIFAGIAAATLAASSMGAAPTIDKGLSMYAPVQGVSGNIKSVGSDTMNNLMTLWGEQFTKFYPAAKIEIEGKGSSTAPAALMENQAQFGPMSREMKSTEIDAFEKKFGYKPTALRTGIDALAVYVHKDNPIKSLTMEQVKQMFSVAGPEKMTWGDLGLTGEWADKPLSLYGRNSASGTYGYFKEHALSKTDYKPTVKEQPGSSAVVQGVASDKFGVGYSGLGYMTADVRAVPLTAKAGSAPVAANADNSYSGEYPLARFLYVYINAKPGADLDPLRKEFIKLIFSQQGQEVVLKDGYIPVTAAIAREDLAKAGIKN